MDAEPQLAPEDQSTSLIHSPGAGSAGGSWTGEALRPYVVGEGGRAFAEVVPSWPSETNNWPDTAVDSGGFGNLDVRAASVRGLKHRYYGRPRQDAYGLATDPQGKYLVAAVADGVGQGQYSEHAARIASALGPRLIVEQLRASVPAELDWAGMYAQVASSIIARGQSVLGRDSSNPTPLDVARNMATTLTIAVLEVGEVSSRVWLSWVGDSPAWVKCADGDWTCLSDLKHDGEDVYSSSVVALPLLRDEPPRIGEVVLHPSDVLILMTDGLGDPLGDARGDVGAFLATAWARPPGDLTFAAQVSFARKSYDDDRTAVAVWCRELA